MVSANPSSAVSQRTFPSGAAALSSARNEQVVEGRVRAARRVYGFNCQVTGSAPVSSRARRWIPTRTGSDRRARAAHTPARADSYVIELTGTGPAEASAWLLAGPSTGRWLAGTDLGAASSPTR